MNHAIPIDEALATKRWCYYVPAIQDTTKHGGYVPSLVIEGDSGHRPMTGRSDQAPWVWGQTLEQAEETCRAVNAQRGITEREANLIVLSSVAAAIREGR